MHYAYPVKLEQHDDCVIAAFPGIDIQTDGANRAEALIQAKDMPGMLVRWRYST